MLTLLGSGLKRVLATNVTNLPLPGLSADAEACVPSASIFAHAFVRVDTGARIVLLGSWCSSSSLAVRVAGAAGALALVINATAGREDIPFASFTMDVTGEVLIGPFAVAIMQLAPA
jgi:hypothetical protein